MKIFGNPDDKKFKLKNLIFNLNIDEKYLKSDLNFRNEIIDKIKNNMSVLDIGKSMREDFNKIKCKEIKTLDINIFQDYPDIQLDLSEEFEIEKTELYERFDVIICLAVLEHVYNPFIAIQNIKKMLTCNGIFFGYVPFLYHYHAPQDLYFQDYYRLLFYNCLRLNLKYLNKILSLFLTNIHRNCYMVVQCLNYTCLYPTNK